MRCDKCTEQYGSCFGTVRSSFFVKLSIESSVGAHKAVLRFAVGFMCLLFFRLRSRKVSERVYSIELRRLLMRHYRRILLMSVYPPTVP